MKTARRRLTSGYQASASRRPLCWTFFSHLPLLQPAIVFVTYKRSLCVRVAGAYHAAPSPAAQAAPGADALEAALAKIDADVEKLLAPIQSSFAL